MGGWLLSSWRRCLEVGGEGLLGLGGGEPVGRCRVGRDGISVQVRALVGVADSVPGRACQGGGETTVLA